MTLEAEGAYIRLLCYGWDDGSIPADISQLASMCKTTPRRMAILWHKFLRECFEPLAEDPDRLVNPRQEMVRENVLAFLRGRAVAGHEGGVASGEARRKQKAASLEAKGSTASILVEANAKQTASNGEANAKQNEAFQSPVSSFQFPKGTNTGEEEKNPLSAGADVAPKYPEDFAGFWEESTRRGSKLEAYRAWKILNPSEVLLTEILAAMSAWRQSEQWQDESKQPHICRWLKRRGWEEIVPRSNGNGQHRESDAEAKQRRTAEASDRVFRKIAERIGGVVPGGAGGSDDQRLCDAIDPVPD